MEVHVEVAPQALWHVGPIAITNTFFMTLVVMALLLIVGTIIARTATIIPSAIQSIFEIIVEFMLGLVEGTAGKRLGRKIFPLIGGLFIFIITANYIELLPGLGTFGLNRNVEGNEVLVPFLRPPTSDLSLTIAMALVSYITFQYLGIASLGVKGRLKHLATPFFVFPIEVISELSRIVSLSFRLFGNIFAGDVLLTVMYAIGAALKFTVIGLLIPVVFLYLEVLFGFVQSLVFALLTLIYISLAAADEHGGHGGEAHGEAEEAHPAPVSVSAGD